MITLIFSFIDKLLSIKVSLVALVKKSVSVHYVWGLLQLYSSQSKKYPFILKHFSLKFNRNRYLQVNAGVGHPFVKDGLHLILTSRDVIGAGQVCHVRPRVAERSMHTARYRKKQSNKPQHSTCYKKTSHYHAFPFQNASQILKN